MMGIGEIGCSNVIYRSGLRYLFSAEFDGVEIPETRTIVTSRPDKKENGSICLGFTEDNASDLCSSIRNLYEQYYKNNIPIEEIKLGTGVLSLWIPSGNTGWSKFETWVFEGILPSYLAWGDIDESNTNIPMIDIIFRYQKMTHTLQGDPNERKESI